MKIFSPLWPEKCILSLLEGFLAKSEESRPPLKWPILGGSTFFTFSQKCLFTELEPIPVWNFDARLLFREKFFQIFAFYKRWSWDIFPSVEHRHGHFWEFFAFSALSIARVVDKKNGLVSEKKFFHNRGGRVGGGSGPFMEFSIIDFIFFLNTSLNCYFLLTLLYALLFYTL